MSMIKDLYKSNYFFRYFLSTIFSFLLTVLLVFLLQIGSFISIEIAFLITQVTKAFLFFYIQKYFTFKNPTGDILKQLRFYTYTLIAFKSLEFLMMILLNLQTKVNCWVMNYSEKFYIHQVNNACNRNSRACGSW